jgi:hypothetical protein
MHCVRKNSSQVRAELIIPINDDKNLGRLVVARKY